MPKEVLIVEDEPDEARSMQMVLEDAGFKTKIAGTVDEAMSQITKKKPDVIVLDIILPMKLGNKLLEDMKNKNMKVPVVVATAIAKSLTTIEKDLKKINKDISFIEKPFEAKKLVSEVKKKLK